MKTMKKVELVGYLGKDPLISITGKGDKKTSLSIATDKFRRDIRASCIKPLTGIMR